jgi:hypothetical protein
MSWPVRLTITDLGSALGDRHLDGANLKITGLFRPLAEARDSVWQAWYILEGLGAAIKIQRLRLSGPSTPLYGEIRWQSNGKQQMWIRGLEQLHTRQDIMRVDQWLQATLKRLPRAGRPPGTDRFGGRQGFEFELRRVIDAIRRQGLRPTRSEVPQFFAQDRKLPRTTDRQLRRWLQTYQITWDDLVRDQSTPPPSNPA